MAEQTGIEWCDATFNPWWGCEKVSPGCAHCYADTLAHRRAPGRELWGAGHEYRLFGDKHWADPLRWARTLPAKLGRRPRVFCASMADVFEERPELEDPRVRLMMLIETTPELDWLVLTKRPEFARDWLGRWHDAIERGNFPAGTRAPRPYPNMWLGVSIENARHTWRADVLRQIPAAIRFISAEPLLGSLFPKIGPGVGQNAVSSAALTVGELERPGRAPLSLEGIDWVIVGGESGPGAREMRPEWAYELVQHCDQHGVAPFVKQLGAVAGKLLNAGTKGQLHEAFPEALKRREFPSSTLKRSVEA